MKTQALINCLNPIIVGLALYNHREIPRLCKVTRDKIRSE